VHLLWVVKTIMQKKRVNAIDEAVTDVQNKVEDTCEEVKEGVNAEETNC